MVRHRGPVLVDTMIMITAHGVGAWRALAGGYQIETVEECLTEFQTGPPNRQQAQQINVAELRAALAEVHDVTDAQRAQIAVRAPDIHLDPGERDLWAHCLTRNDNWVLCGPDKASLRLGIRLGFRDRLISLERLLSDAGQPRVALRPAYTENWHRQTVTTMALDELL